MNVLIAATVTLRWSCSTCALPPRREMTKLEIRPPKSMTSEARNHQIPTLPRAAAPAAPAEGGGGGGGRGVGGRGGAHGGASAAAAPVRCGSQSRVAPGTLYS